LEFEFVRPWIIEFNDYAGLAKNKDFYDFEKEISFFLFPTT